MTEQTQSAKEEKQEQAPQGANERPEIELSAKIDKDGHLTWRIPKDLRMAFYLNEHLRTMISDMHLRSIAAQIETEKAKKPNIITSMKQNPVMRRIFR